jgi:hypothetical protein
MKKFSWRNKGISPRCIFGKAIFPNSKEIIIDDDAKFVVAYDSWYSEECWFIYVDGIIYQSIQDIALWLTEKYQKVITAEEVKNLGWEKVKILCLEPNGFEVLDRIEKEKERRRAEEEAQRKQEEKLRKERNLVEWREDLEKYLQVLKKEVDRVSQLLAMEFTLENYEAIKKGYYQQRLEYLSDDDC